MPEPVCCCGTQVLGDRQIREDHTTFGNETDALPRDPKCRQTDDFDASNGNRTFRWLHDSEYRLDGGGLTHTVASQQSYDFAAADNHRYVKQHLAIAVARTQAPYLKHLSTIFA